MIIPGNREVAILWIEFMSADLPTLGTPTTITRSVGSFAIASFSFNSTSPSSCLLQDQTLEGLKLHRRLKKVKNHLDKMKLVRQFSHMIMITFLNSGRVMWNAKILQNPIYNIQDTATSAAWTALLEKIHTYISWLKSFKSSLQKTCRVQKASLGD